MTKKKPLSLNAYQDLARQTAGYPKQMGIPYCTLGLCGESGEVSEKVKKAIRDDAGVFTGEKLEATAYELGDVLWYAANLAYELGYTLEEIAEMNIAKLASRKQRGKLHGSGDNR